MTTRIKYHRNGNNLASNYLTNFEGKKFQVIIHCNVNHLNDPCFYSLSIINESNDVIFRRAFETSSKAKRFARRVLISNCHVNLNEEIRPRNLV